MWWFWIVLMAMIFAFCGWLGDRDKRQIAKRMAAKPPSDRVFQYAAVVLAIVITVGLLAMAGRH